MADPPAIPDLTQRVWQRQYDDARNAIPASWLVSLPDGFIGIQIQRRSELIVQLYWKLAQVGFARGWL